MKKLLSIVLVLVFIVNICGTYWTISLLQKQIYREIKHRIRNGLKEEELTLIVVPENDESALEWEKPGKEFKYSGFMYDVVRLEIKNGKKYYHCINDLKEKFLLDNYNKTHKNNSESAKRLKKVHLNKFFCASYSIIQYNNKVNSVCEYKFYGFTNPLKIIFSPPPNS